MSHFRAVFSKPHIFLVVIHVKGSVRALKNVGIAQAGGADGVFLINHAISSNELREVYFAARRQYPKWWIGLNFLGISNLTAHSFMPVDSSGLWVDNVGLEEGTEDPSKAARDLSEKRKLNGFRGLYFGGVPFKYQRRTEDPGGLARLAKPYVDVVTTSGNTTGRAPDVKKVVAMRKAIGDHPLAITSGITDQNVSRYLALADCFLITSGVSDSHAELNPTLVERLARKISP